MSHYWDLNFEQTSENQKREIWRKAPLPPRGNDGYRGVYPEARRRTQLIYAAAGCGNRRDLKTSKLYQLHSVAVHGSRSHHERLVP